MISLECALTQMFDVLCRKCKMRMKRNSDADILRCIYHIYSMCVASYIQDVCCLLEKDVATKGADIEELFKVLIRR
jgi:hypothetical protein